MLKTEENFQYFNWIIFPNGQHCSDKKEKIFGLITSFLVSILMPVLVPDL